MNSGPHKNPEPEPEQVAEPVKHVDREGLGRSRGGLSTRIHLLADSRCRPLARATTAGQRHDTLAFEPLMGRLRIRRRGRGRPRTRPARLLADKAYPNRKIRTYLRRHRIKATIPEKSDQQKARAAKGSTGGRPPAFDTEAYTKRNTVERTNTSSKPSARSPCAPTNASSSSPAPSTSHRSRPGSATPPTKIHETRPSSGPPA
ncbi:MAG: transposase [Pseudonocardia sp.]